MKNNILNHKLLVIIIKKGLSGKVIKYAKEGGTVGWTLIYGRGSAEKHIYENILGIEYEPEKEIILIALKSNDVDNVLNTITEKMQLKKPGKGIGFVVDIKKCIGIAHLIDINNKGRENNE